MQDPSSIFSGRLSTREAQRVARVLKQHGYTKATILRCTGPLKQVAEFFEPEDLTARDHLRTLIAHAAGWIPARKETV